MRIDNVTEYGDFESVTDTHQVMVGASATHPDINGDDVVSLSSAGDDMDIVGSSDIVPGIAGDNIASLSAASANMDDLGEIAKSAGVGPLEWFEVSQQPLDYILNYLSAVAAPTSTGAASSSA